MPQCSHDRGQECRGSHEPEGSEKLYKQHGAWSHATSPGGLGSGSIRMLSERQHTWYMRVCVFFIPAERKSYQPNVRLVSAWRGGCKGEKPHLRPTWPSSVLVTCLVIPPSSTPLRNQQCNSDKGGRFLDSFLV